MTVDEALAKIHAPKGLTSMIAGVMSGDFAPIQDQNAEGSSLTLAMAELERAQRAQVNAKSDWAFWGYQGDVSYWRAVVSILEAAEITGPNDLPDIEGPDLTNCVVMDACSKVESFGKAILEQAKQ